MKSLVALGAILSIRLYQASWNFFLPPSCRFYPSCSEYAIDALRKYGPLNGSFKSLKRICRCHPLNPGGYDPA